MIQAWSFSREAVFKIFATYCHTHMQYTKKYICVRLKTHVRARKLKKKEHAKGMFYPTIPVSPVVVVSSDIEGSEGPITAPSVDAGPFGLRFLKAAHCD